MEIVINELPDGRFYVELRHEEKDIFREGVFDKKGILELIGEHLNERR